MSVAASAMFAAGAALAVLGIIIAIQSLFRRF